jgi:signal transduction protein with GAF and PtsI domain
MAEVEFTEQLAAVAADLGQALAPAAERRALTRLCEAVLATMNCGAASVAVLDEDRGELRWRAAAGPGADVVAELVLPLGQGIAGFVAAAGQSLAIDDVRADPRFARETAERTGYVPETLLAVPILGDDDAVLGVLSVLDRERRPDDMAVAGAFAAVAAAILPTGLAVRGLGAVLLDTIADAAAAADEGAVAESLRRRAASAPPAEAELARLAALLVDLRALGPRAQATAIRMVEAFLDYAQRRL